MSLIHTTDLTKDYGRHRALADMTLDIPRGEIFGLLGPNGSGKSTAIRILLGFLQPTAGSARIADLDCWRDSVEVRRKVAYLPGELRLYESMSGRQLISFLESIRRQEFVIDPDALALGVSGGVPVLLVLFGVGLLGYLFAWRTFKRRDLPAPL